MRRGLEVVGLVLVVQGFAVFAAEQVYSDLRDNQSWFRTIVVSESGLDLQELERTARGFLNSAGRRSVVVLTVFSNSEDAAMTTAAARDSYRGWRNYYEEMSRRPLRAGQAIAIKGNSVLRLRHADGTTESHVLAGQNPLRFDSDGTSFEILMVTPRVGTKFDQCQSENSISPVVYVKTGSSLTPHLCNKAAARLAQLLDTRNLFASFRNDHWFISFGGFPVVYPFSPDTVPPSEEEYYDSIAVTCNIACGEKPSCIQTLGPTLSRRRPGRK